MNDTRFALQNVCAKNERTLAGLNEFRAGFHHAASHDPIIASEGAAEPVQAQYPGIAGAKGKGRVTAPLTTSLRSLVRSLNGTCRSDSGTNETTAYPPMLTVVCVDSTLPLDRV
jgi:hypothetical protein